MNLEESLSCIYHGVMRKMANLNVDSIKAVDGYIYIYPLRLAEETLNIVTYEITNMMETAHPLKICTQDSALLGSTVDQFLRSQEYPL